MKKYIYSLPQQSREFEVRAKTREEARQILEDTDDLTDYEVEPVEIWQPSFEFLGEEE
jgi:hypothetical protein